MFVRNIVVCLWWDEMMEWKFLEVLWAAVFSAGLAAASPRSCCWSHELEVGGILYRYISTP